MRNIRGKPREFVIRSKGRVLAGVPIIVYDPEQQMNVAKAHVVVSYVPKIFNFSDERVFSLFVQVLLISLVIGLFLFYLLYKIIEYIFRRLYEQLDQAIQQGATHIELGFNFPIFQSLLTIINSLIARSQIIAPADSPTNSAERLPEIVGIMNMMPIPALLIQHNKTIYYVNQKLAELASIPEGFVTDFTISAIPDIALQQNLNFLIEQAKINTHEVVTDQLEMQGVLCRLSCQALHIYNNDPDYFLISIAPEEGSS